MKTRQSKRKPRLIKTDKDLESCIKTLRFDKTTQISPRTGGVQVSVCMIVKNCADSLGRCLESLEKNFLAPGDEVVIVDTGSTDKTCNVARKHGARVIERPELRKDMGALVDKWLPEHSEKFRTEGQFDKGCLLDFAEARQIGMDAAKHDIIFWIDSDDILAEETPGKLREVVDRSMEEFDAIFLNYLYSFDKNDKRCTTILKRERIVDRRSYYWRGKCHETLIPRPGVTPRNVAYFEDLNAAIVHADGRQDHQLSDIRNYCIIRNEIEEDLRLGQLPDVRSIFYLGNAARGLRRHAEAISMYRKTLDLSGSRDDKYSSAYYIAITYLAPDIRRPLDALDLGFDLLKLKPEDPRGPYLISRCYHLLGRNQESIHWYNVGRLLPEPRETLHSYDPEHISSMPAMIAVSAARELGDEGMVNRFMNELVRLRADHPDVKLIGEDTTNWFAGRHLQQAIKTLTRNCQPKDAKAFVTRAREVMAPLDTVPPELEEEGIGKLEPADDRFDGGIYPDVGIFCGRTHETWGPMNAVTGIGGSEKAVIMMAPRLQKKGFRVTVYASVPFNQRGLDQATGVVWRHWSEFDYTRPRGVMIFWRNPAALEMPIPCTKRIVWCHDVQNPADWTETRCALADQVWVLSEYHKATLGEAAGRLGDKVIVTRNGIDSALFEKLGSTPRKANRVIFSSSPDRGVMTAIKAFQAATKDPDAELHIAYGFNKHYFETAKSQEYRGIPDLNRDYSMYDYVKLVYAACDADPRITYHGRVSWDKLAGLMSSAGVWLYPTRFHEISCMSAMEAQAAGCVPVCSRVAALKETVFVTNEAEVFPDKPEDTARVLACAMNGGQPTDYARNKMIDTARRRFSYDTLAEEWSALLK